jgi:hypothetical protein
MKIYFSESLATAATITKRHPVRVVASLLSVGFGIFMAFAFFQLNDKPAVDQLFLYEMTAIGGIGIFVGLREIAMLFTVPESPTA